MLEFDSNLHNFWNFLKSETSGWVISKNQCAYSQISLKLRWKWKLNWTEPSGSNRSREFSKMQKCFEIIESSYRKYWFHLVCKIFRGRSVSSPEVKPPLASNNFLISLYDGCGVGEWLRHLFPQKQIRLDFLGKIYRRLLSSRICSVDILKDRVAPKLHNNERNFL